MGAGDRRVLSDSLSRVIGLEARVLVQPTCRLPVANTLRAWGVSKWARLLKRRASSARRMVARTAGSIPWVEKSPSNMGETLAGSMAEPGAAVSP